jgi:trk system potassium uptake protein TrkH
MRFAAIIYAIGWGGLCASMLLLLPLLAAWLIGEAKLAPTFFISFVLGAFFSSMLILIGRPARKIRARRQDLIIAGIGVWLFVPIIAALPLLASVQIGSFREAIFESLSLFTTTGSTVILYPELEPFSLNFWRHLVAWLGGLWSLVFAISILATMEIVGNFLSASPLLQHDESENIAERFLWPAQNIAKLYIMFSIAAIVALILSGLSGGDAINFALSAISTTGVAPFSYALTKEMSALGISIISLVNFVGAIGIPLWFILRTRISGVVKDKELQLFVVLIISYFLVVAVAYQTPLYTGFLHSLSLSTTTAFQILPVEQTVRWSPIWIVLPAAIGGMALSTAGGIKVMRVWALSRFIYVEISRIVYPSVVMPVNLGGRRLQQVDWQAIAAHLVVFLLVIPVIIFGYATLNTSFETAWVYAYAFVSNAAGILRQLDMLHTVASFDLFEQSLAMAAMIFGRLELILGLALMSPTFWRFAK